MLLILIISQKSFVIKVATNRTTLQEKLDFEKVLFDFEKVLGKTMLGNSMVFPNTLKTYRLFLYF